jgi:hypothetical protein
MAQRVIVQDGIVLYTASDPLSVDMDFSVAGQVNVSKQVNIGDDLLAPGLIETPLTSGVDLILRTHNDGGTYGNIRLDSATDGNRIILNNVAWPDGTVSPVPGMYLGVSALNTLQFYTLPAGSTPAYEIQSAVAAQTVFNTLISTIANSPGVAHLQVFVNGVKQIEGLSKNYQVTGPNQITFNAGLLLSDDVEFYAFP